MAPLRDPRRGPSRLLINFSLNNETSRTGQLRLAPRVIVIAHDERWTGAIERFDDSDLDVAADLGDLTIGGNRMIVQPDGYQVLIDLPEQDIQRQRSTSASVSRPFVVNNQPVGERPDVVAVRAETRADGWLRIGGREHRLDERTGLSRSQLGSVLVG